MLYTFTNFSTARKREEKYLRQVVVSLFPSTKITFNSRRDTNIKSPFTGNLLEIDIWIPELRLGFEYQVNKKLLFVGVLIYGQDKHHFISTWYSNKPLDEYLYSLTDLSYFIFLLKRYRSIDSTKKQLMEAKGYTLIVVPCWWDMTAGRFLSLYVYFGI